MNQVRRILFTAIILGTFAFSGCNSLKKMVKMAKDQQLTVEPSPLELQGDSVSFTMSAQLPVKMLKKGKVYTVNTFYQYGDERTDVGSLEFRAEDFPNGAEQQPSESRNMAFAYTGEAMDNGTLMVQGVASDPNKDKQAETPEMEVAKGLITTQNMVAAPTFVVYSDHGYNNQEELLPNNVSFFFPQGSSVLRTSEVRSDRGSRFQNFIAEKNVTRSVTITGTHSPEGEERVNERLSEDRAQRIEEYYRQQMDRYDYKGSADSIDFILKPVVENWGPFRDSLQGYSDISESEKQAYFDIIDGSGSFEEKEDQLHQLPTYRQVFRDVYPNLRLAETEVLTVKEKKPDGLIATLAKLLSNDEVSTDTLSNEELLYGGTLTPSLEEREGIYMAATKKDDSYASHNNLGAVYLAQAIEAGESGQSDLLEKAVAQFELAAQRENNAEAHANLATVYMMQGNKEKAEEEISEATGMQPSMPEAAAGISGIEGAIAIARGKYDQAVSSLSNANESASNLFNLGLAQILTGNYESAITSFEESLGLDSEYSKANYGIAIANAYLQNDQGIFDALKKAVAGDGNLRETALNDLVFGDYQEQQSFRDALQ
ncbi:MAG: tetratricopeptide repeat protein [Tunicatimonas sp.]